MVKQRWHSPLLGLPAATDLTRSWLLCAAGPPEGEDIDDGLAGTSAPSSSLQAGASRPGPPSAKQGNGTKRNGANDGAPKLLTAPEGLIGTATQMKQRVIQVAFGSEHGALLNDAGVVFTWGDNRYGQLGRDACLIEEDCQPFPVTGLLDQEVTHVAAGKHHCLALSTPGLVWSWGRNKAGQLGTGDFKDQVAVQGVRHAATGESREEHQLGAGGPGQHITSISAGANSSVASAMNSDIWQWGEISTAFTELKKESRRPGRDKDDPANTSGSTNRPLCVFSRDAYRTRMRRKPVRLSETACRPLIEKLSEDDKHRIEDMMSNVRQLQGSIADRRKEVARMQSDKKKGGDKTNAEARQSEADEVQDMSDTLAMLEGEISATDHDIYLYEKNLESCKLQQAHCREQLQHLSEQAIELGEREDTVYLDLIEKKTGSAEWKVLQDKLAEVKEYIAANQNSRMAMLDQRAQMDKEKQRVSRSLDEKIRLKDELNRRFQTVRDLSKDSIRVRDTSDILLKFLSEQRQDIIRHASGKVSEEEFVAAMKALEGEEVFLRGVEAKTKAFTDHVLKKAGPNALAGIRATHLRNILQDLLNAAQGWKSLVMDRWVKDDLDLSCFFNKAAKPGPPSSLQALPLGGPLQLQDGTT